MGPASQKPRLDGLDFARFLAFVGMVFVNFKIVMGAEGGKDWLSIATGALEGRAAATFVVLAGVGLGLSAMRGDISRTVGVTVKRAIFLLVLGLVNVLIFDADILHYYAFYFLFGVLLLRLSSRGLAVSVLLIVLSSVGMLLVLDYDAGWDWTNYTYQGFWTPTGFVRNLFFNGWHPVFPWLAFLLYGIILGRSSLGEKKTQLRMIGGGVLLVAVAETASRLLQPALASIHPELIYFATTAPIPPMPLYVLSGIGTATAVIGLCMRSAEWLSRGGVLAVVNPAGRQTLTLYVAHIIIGMGTLEVFGMIGGQSILAATLAATVFCLLTVVYAYYWSRSFKRGPIETLMRRIAG